MTHDLVEAEWPAWLHARLGLSRCDASSQPSSQLPLAQRQTGGLGEVQAEDMGSAHDQTKCCVRHVLEGSAREIDGRIEAAVHLLPFMVIYVTATLSCRYLLPRVGYH